MKSISIPIEIVPSSNSNSYSRHISPSYTFRNDYPYSDFTNSPPRINSYSKTRFQPRPNPTTAYDRLLKHSPLNQPVYDRPLYQEPSAFYHSRSNEDLLSSPITSKRAPTQPQTNGIRSESDFIQPNKSTNSLRRSFNVLNDDRPTYVNQTFIHPQEYRVPTTNNCKSKFFSFSFIINKNTIMVV